jgi:hypothetical protein
VQEPFSKISMHSFVQFASSDCARAVTPDKPGISGSSQIIGRMTAFSYFAQVVGENKVEIITTKRRARFMDARSDYESV